MEHHPFSHLRQLLPGKNHVDNGLDHLHHLVVSIHMQQSLVPLALNHHTDYPDHAQHVVGMRMGNEEVMNIRNLNIHLLQLREDSISSARIHQQQSAGSLEQKTGVINLGNRSISRSEHRNLIRNLSRNLIRYLIHNLIHHFTIFLYDSYFVIYLIHAHKTTHFLKNHQEKAPKTLRIPNNNLNFAA